MATITTKQIKQIHTLLPAHIKGNPEAKEDLIYQFTQNENKLSTKDLTYQQANDLIVSLNGKIASTPISQYGRFDRNNKQHLYLLSLCRQMGWVVFNKKQNKLFADIDRLGEWLKTTGYLKKPLMSYDSSELPKLVKQFEQVLKNTKL